MSQPQMGSSIRIQDCQVSNEIIRGEALATQSLYVKTTRQPIDTTYSTTPRGCIETLKTEQNAEASILPYIFFDALLPNPCLSRSLSQHTHEREKNEEDLRSLALRAAV